MSYDSLAHTVTSLGGIFAHYLREELRTRGENGPFFALRVMTEGGPQGVRAFFQTLSTYPRDSDTWKEAVYQFTRFMGNGTATPGHVSVFLNEAKAHLARGVGIDPSATFPNAPRTMMGILDGILPNLRRFGHMDGISENLARVEELLGKARKSLNACARYRSDELYRTFVQVRNGAQPATAQNVRQIMVSNAAADVTFTGIAIQLGNMSVSALAAAGTAGLTLIVGAAAAAGAAGTGTGCLINSAIGEPCLGDWNLEPTLLEKRQGIIEAVEAEKERYRIYEPYGNGTLYRN